MTPHVGLRAAGASPRAEVLVLDSGDLAAAWPFLTDRLAAELSPAGHTLRREILYPGRGLGDVVGIGGVSALVLLGAEPEPADLAAAPGLAIVAGAGRIGSALAVELADRDIPYIDGARGQDDSRAELAIALILSALRSIPVWHTVMAVEGDRAWPLPGWQYSDHPGYVNGTLAGKHVVVAGLSPVGVKIAALCTAFGATVTIHDPSADPAEFTARGLARIDLAAEPRAADILVIAPGASQGLVSGAVIDQLEEGVLVVTLDAAGVDLAAVRARALHHRLAWATDVYDTTPVDRDDPILHRPNIIHVPGIGSRTRDAIHAVADVLAENIVRVLRGEPPHPADLVVPAHDHVEVVW